MIPTVRSTRSLEIDTATRARTGQIRHAAGSFRNFPRLVLLVVLLRLQPLHPRILVPLVVLLQLRLLPLLQLRLQPQPNLRTTRGASAREIVPVTFFASCASTRMTWNKRRSLITTSSNFHIIPVSSFYQGEFVSLVALGNLEIFHSFFTCVYCMNVRKREQRESLQVSQGTNGSSTIATRIWQ